MGAEGLAICFSLPGRIFQPSQFGFFLRQQARKHLPSCLIRLDCKQLAIMFDVETCHSFVHGEFPYDIPTLNIYRLGAAGNWLLRFDWNVHKKRQSPLSLAGIGARPHYPSTHQVFPRRVTMA